MPGYCTLCKKSFKTQQSLDQHVQNSFAHRKTAQGPPQVQDSVQSKLPAVISQKQEQLSPSLSVAISHRFKPAEADGLTPGATTRHNHVVNAIPSSSSNLQILSPAINTFSQNTKSPWSIITESQYTTVGEALSASCHSPAELKENGYLLHPYNPQDHVYSRKCKRCNVQETNARNRECTFHPKNQNKMNPKRQYSYRCCQTEGKGCRTLPTHDFQLPLRAVKHKDFLKTPAASAGQPRFSAVTLDCEMAGTAGGSGEAIFLCVADYFTGALLLNTFICPSQKIVQMRTPIHGISRFMLNAAILQGQALSGWEGARKELWKYVDDNTILIGHALEHDLDALRISHPRVVDSGILSRNAVGIPRIQWGLKRLCLELLHLEIRKNKDGIHDCSEDVLATREVVLFCTLNKEAFQIWARATKTKEIRQEEERKIAWQEEQARKDALEGKGGRISAGSMDTSQVTWTWI